ncbi:MULTISPECIES: FAD-binding oxidoreductase [unclassified Bradyrhizobium]|uniref:NAD(P)/FAD-dependent oxidoreductase n=1 Tax=unclassified Bradyrhizobium TaxID=2631580 RepID=UPI001BA5CFC9|nr:MULTISPECIES: FAD-dependent oxidoreductase [unclassified Bradyrhizobium]MBR1205689.1 FAD-dependent oxidoreductase [Bradyrhizobium sp. AUGA SZCCT0124]MBR1313862.1 FAD-dependent oxidoreductase [Bradyrhizobium sp. AUGA SZCCT0051]MBR1338016.1 FAD-dependent oxidoreductase [Bradyrhizobium sp. AUGA SZCCT0105]MBR1355671.1 FAD-dependent oxidoreductase [Bradyrhizobium sp. AUGA SZCCT0045]
MAESAGRHVAIIGAGAVGVISAIEALRAGHRVTLIDPGEPGGTQAASYGNAGWLSSHSVIPPAEPGTWKKVPFYLMDPLGPLSIRWSYLPKALPWLIKYLLSSRTEAQVEATARAMRDLLKDAPLLHRQLAEEAGVPELIERRGVMHVFPSRAPFDRDLGWRIRKRVGIEWLELDEDEMRQREPDLHPRYKFGVVVEEAGRCRDPGAYVAALAAHAIANGAVRVAAKATGLKLAGDRLVAVVTESGEIASDAAVVAAGARSKQLTASIGDPLPLETERGYHVMIENPESGPRSSMMASDAKMVVNWTDKGLRAAGTVEIAGLDAEPNWKRAEILREHLFSMFPKLPKDIPPSRIKTWFGHRPSMPDGRPCIGHSRASRDVVYAFGHGHVGLVGSARTGRLVAQLLSGKVPEIPLQPFAPSRFL